MAITIKQMYDRLGITGRTYSLSWLNNANNHKLINKWSLNKPMQYNGENNEKTLTDAQKKQIMYGYTCADSLVLTYDALQKYYSGASALPSAWAVASGQEHLSLGYGWRYTPNTSVHRLSDWIGYDHAIDYLFKCSTMEEEITQGVAITFTIYMQVAIGVFASRFGNMYLGIMMWSKTSPTTYRYIKTMEAKISTVGLTAQITLTATDTAQLTEGDWVFGLFASASIASTLPSDKSQSYYVTKWTTGNCEAIPFTPTVISVVEPPILWSLVSASGGGRATNKTINYTYTIRNTGTTNQTFTPDSSLAVNLYKTNAQNSTETFQQTISLSRTSSASVVVAPGASVSITYSGSLPTLIATMYYAVRLTIGTQGIEHIGEGIFVGNAASFVIS